MLVVTRDGLKTEEQLIEEDAKDVKVICFTCGYMGANRKCCAEPVQIQLA